MLRSKRVDWPESLRNARARTGLKAFPQIQFADDTEAANLLGDHFAATIANYIDLVKAKSNRIVSR